VEIAARSFGKTGSIATRVGLGGEGVLRTHGRSQEALAVIEEAARQGITYFDSARAYAGSEGYYGAFWKQHSDLRSRIFQTSKSASRTKEDAEADLVGTLAAMGLDHLDLWQIHDVRTREDLEIIEGPGGALQAFIEAKETGLVRFIGVTGHHDPIVLEHAVSRWPVDSVLLPVNPAEAVLGGFLDHVMTAAQDRDLAVIGMKILGGSHYISPEAGITPEQLIRFAVSKGITVAIVGCSKPEEVQALAKVGREFEPLAAEEEENLIGFFRPYARRLAFYRGAF